MNRKMMQRLMWKDGRTLAPLALATLAAVIGFNLLLIVLASLGTVGRERLMFAQAIWFLLPNLLAFGASAMLVGGEEESGSMAWLRTLPATWRSVALSKLAVALGALLVAWIASSLGFALQWAVSPDDVVTWTMDSGRAPESFTVLFGVQLMFSVTLMLTSFLMAYLFRSPVNALLAVVPVMMVFVIGFLNLQDYLLKGQNTQVRWESLTPEQWGTMLALIAASMLALFWLHQWTARRRLVGPETDLRKSLQKSVSADAFRPPRPLPVSWYGASLGNRRPAKMRALLWQASRQNFWTLVLLTIVASIGVTVALWTEKSVSDLASFLSGVALFGIAGLTFYGDSVRKRCVFLSDRGISPTLVWRTRLIPTAIAVSLVVGVVMINSMLIRVRDYDLLTAVTLLVVGYALCQLVSQWSPRPALAFFAPPVVAFLAFALCMPLIQYYREGALWAAWASIPIFLFASWRLTPRWLSGSMGRDYTVRFVGYIAIAVFLPYALVYCGRLATLPDDQTQWRQQTLAFELPERPADQTRVQIYPDAIPDESLLYDSLRREGYLFASDPDDFEQRFAKEMAADDSVGQFVSFNELVARVPSWPTGAPAIDFYDNTPQSTLAERDAEELRMSRLFSKWSAMIRNEARYGDATFKQVVQVAERADEIVGMVLEEHVKRHGMTPEIEELVKLFPDNDLVLQSRRNSLIVAWKKYRQSPDNGIQFTGTFHHPRPLLWPKLELLRRQRYTDQTVKMAEQHWRLGTLSNLGDLPEFHHDSREAGLWDLMGPLKEVGVRERIESLRGRIQ